MPKYYEFKVCGYYLYLLICYNTVMGTAITVGG